MNDIENVAWRSLSWVLTVSPVVYLVLRLIGVINYPNDGWGVYGLVVVAFCAWTARKFMDS